MAEAAEERPFPPFSEGERIQKPRSIQVTTDDETVPVHSTRRPSTRPGGSSGWLASSRSTNIRPTRIRVRRRQRTHQTLPVPKRWYNRCRYTTGGPNGRTDPNGDLQKN